MRAISLASNLASLKHKMRCPYVLSFLIYRLRLLTNVLTATETHKDSGYMGDDRKSVIFN